MQIVIASLMGLLIFSTTASDFGTYTERAKNHLQEERVKHMVTQSQSARQEVESGREVANFSSEDKAWADEYTKLMSDDSSTDYLKKSIEL